MAVICCLHASSVDRGVPSSQEGRLRERRGKEDSVREEGEGGEEKRTVSGRKEGRMRAREG